VVVNLLGPRRNLKTLSDFEYINIEVPRRLAEACQKNPNVIRMIHFSSAGASPDSPSMDLRTKYFGEQEVNFTNNYI
jgi:NADH dehydrogenase (ubiquinone) 1 alpha subcomplex subunit 9